MNPILATSPAFFGWMFRSTLRSRLIASDEIIEQTKARDVYSHYGEKLWMPKLRGKRSTRSEQTFKPFPGPSASMPGVRNSIELHGNHQPNLQFLPPSRRPLLPHREAAPGCGSVFPWLCSSQSGPNRAPKFPIRVPEFIRSGGNGRVV